jgi:hypothetical protein
MLGIPVYLIVAVALVLIAALTWALWPHKIHGKHMVNYHQKTYDEVKASGKCRHNLSVAAIPASALSMALGGHNVIRCSD